MNAARTALPQQQAMVLMLASQDKSIKITARVMGIEPRTVKGHRARIIRKYGVTGIQGAIAEGFRRGDLQ